MGPTTIMDAMTGESVRCSVTVTNPNGFHLRPIQAFVETAHRFQSSVAVCKDGAAERVDGKSALGLLGMAAEEGSVLHLEVSGPDSREALQALAEIFQRDWPEEN